MLVASKGTGLEVNADKTKDMVMSWDQDAGRSHNKKLDNRSFQRMEQFKYLAITLMNQNSIQQTDVREHLLLFSAKSFDFQFATQKYKDEDIQNYNFACCFVWV